MLFENVKSDSLYIPYSEDRQLVIRNCYVKKLKVPKIVRSLYIADCEELLSLEMNDELEEIVIYDCNKLGIVKIPQSAVELSVFDCNSIIANYDGENLLKLSLSGVPNIYTIKVNGRVTNVHLSNLSNLKSVVFNDAVTDIVMSDCPLVETLFIPDETKRVETLRVKNMPSLKRMNIPSSVEDLWLESLPLFGPLTSIHENLKYLHVVNCPLIPMVPVNVFGGISITLARKED